MPAGAAVLKYAGKRGTTWSLKYEDASGRQVRERLGKASDGWNRRKAEAALRARLVAFEREGYRRPEPTTFESFAVAWLDELETKGLKRSTRSGYKTIVDRHLLGAFGSLRLEEVSVERIERYLAAKRKAGLAPATLHRQLATLSLIFGAALRRGLVRANPVPLVERPKAERRRWRILSPEEVGAIERAFDVMIAEAMVERDGGDYLSARVLFLTLMGTGSAAGRCSGFAGTRFSSLTRMGRC
jgi:hypothetical protein